MRYLWRLGSFCSYAMSTTRAFINECFLRASNQPAGEAGKGAARQPRTNPGISIQRAPDPRGRSVRRQAGQQVLRDGGRLSVDDHQLLQRWQTTGTYSNTDRAPH
eukprot:GHVU01133441.1.p2 GENE.GHVU01133441.1~~GHVU01133441.1.p2  ORF type:complete len:105 (+),score=5.07 GHVU01133441.1:638-952(+)